MKKRIGFLFLSGILTIFVCGCSTVEPAKQYGHFQLQSMKTAYVVLSDDTDRNIGGYIQEGLSQHGVKTTSGALKDKPQNVDFYVEYMDHWQWDMTMYLSSLDIRFIDNASQNLIASGSFKNSFFHSFPYPKTKTFEVIDSIYGVKVER